MKPNIDIDPETGIKAEFDPETGVTTYYPPDHERLTLADVPQKTGDTTDAQQLQYLMGFIEEFKNYMDFSHMETLLKFILIPLLQDEEKRSRFLEALDEARTQEEAEIQDRLQQDPEATLDSIPHGGLDLIRNVLENLQEMTNSEKQQLIKQFYKTPKVLNMINTKATNVIFDPEQQETIRNRFDLEVSRKKAKKEIIVPAKIVISLDDETDDTQLSQILTPYDRMVYDGVCTVLLNNPQPLATANQIYSAFAGKGTKSQKALERVNRSLNKLSNTKIFWDVTSHTQAKGNTNVQSDIIGRKLLNFYDREVISGGKKTWSYCFLDKPVLYQYASDVGQIITVDRTLLDVGTISNTDNNNLIKTYLLRRIESMKAKHNSIKSNRIRYDTIIKCCNLQTGSKTEKARLRETVIKILEYWKSEGYIKDFSEYKESRAFAGVEISL